MVCSEWNPLIYQDTNRSRWFQSRNVSDIESIGLLIAEDVFLLVFCWVNTHEDKQQNNASKCGRMLLWWLTK